ncbi:hypothetical protein SPRG_13925 [Saprolegnia parasitica CBS 223.65]|uniref:Uncharacterized protein n=1 Tax=Saprolegnia parasitica (strain CBS 223.65) TaxID=695850 RepID=A0A067BQH5_SAPPC|nr:hypothetical protein SPRG_13925 [Saprolegnia parasitica CBS 223.65]KDO20714.1 hypothetical protein SPRG_13925 [Saprolegnia parasitica CBS 223.65]|eukprot:XP_012208595.1 hypothetical protein SPRG_13925 [Saprolegnia parasitica CBS 223.65]
MASSGIPSYLRSTSSSSSKVKKDPKAEKKKTVDFPVRRAGAKKEEFRVRPPPAPLSIAIPSTPTQVASALASQKVTKRAVPSPKKPLKRASSTIADERKMRSPPTTMANVPSYMRQTVSRGYKEGTLLHPAEPSSVSPPKKAPTPRQAPKIPTAFKLATTTTTVVKRTPRAAETSRDPMLRAPPTKEPDVLIDPVGNNNPECKTPPPPVDEHDAFHRTLVVPRAAPAASPDHLHDPMSVDEALDLAVAMRTIASLQDAAAATAEDLARLEAERHDALMDRDVLQTNMDKILETELLEHKMALTEIKKQVVASTEAKHESMAATEQRVVDLTAHVATLELEKRGRDKDLEHLNRICGALQLQVNAFEAAQAEWSHKTSRMAEMEETLATLQLRAEVSEDVQRQMAAAASDRAALVAEYDAKLAHEHEKIARLEAQIIEHAALVQAMPAMPADDATVRQLRQQLEHAVHALEDRDVATHSCLTHDMEIARLHGEIESYVEQLRDIEAMLTRVRDEKAELSRDTATTDARVALLQSQLDEIQVEKDHGARLHAQLTATIAQRDERIRALESDATRLQRDADAEWTARLEATTKDADRRNEAVEAAYEVQVRELTDELAVAVSTAEHAVAARKQAESDLIALQTELVEKAASLQSLSSDHGSQEADWLAELEERDAANAALTRRIEELEAAIAATNTARDELAKQAATHAAVTESYVAQIAEIEAQKRALQVDYETEQARTQSLDASCAAAEAEATRHLSQIDVLTSDIRQNALAHEAEVADLKASMAALQAQLQGHVEAAHALQATHSNYEADAASHAAVVESFTVQIEALQTQLAARDANEAELLAAHQETKDALDEARYQVDELEARAHDAETEVESAHVARTEALEATIRELETRLEANAPEKIVDAMRRQQDETTAAHDLQLQVLQESQRELKALEAAKTRQLTTLEASHEQLGAELLAAKKTIAALEAQLSTKTQPSAVVVPAVPRPIIGKGVVVVHFGSFELHAGLLHADTASYVPTLKLPTLVAVPQGGAAELHRVLQGSSYIGAGSVRIGYENGYFLGRDAVTFLYEHPDPALRCILKQERVFQNGHVTSTEYLEGLLHQVFTGLGIDDVISSYNVIVTHKPQLAKASRESLADVLFEKCAVKGALLATDALMSLRARGKSTGLVLDVGADATYIVPIYEDMILDHAVVVTSMGGDALVNFMVSMLLSQESDEYHKIPLRLQQKIARAMLETKGMVAKDFEAMAEKHGRFERAHVQVLPTESQPVWQKAVPHKNTAAHPLHAVYAYRLPSGSTLELQCDVERFIAPELLWQPKLNPDNAGEMALHDALAKAFAECDSQLHHELLANVVCTGGACQLPGFKARVHQEIQKICPFESLIAVDVVGKDDCATFAGTCMYASSLKDRSWITCDEFDVNGAAVLHAKCF